MANENRSDQPWKKLLEDEVALPGELLADKAAAWQELHYRLHLSSHRKRTVWYWVAAASLLLMISIPFSLLQNSRNSVVKNAAPKKEMPLLHKQPPAAKGAATIVETVTVVHSTKGEAIKNKTKDSSHSVAVSDDPGLAVNSREENVELSSLPPLVVDSSSAMVSAAVQPKKQLKVVHVNELGDPVVESPAWTHNTEQHSFELQIGKEEVVTNTAASFNKPRFAVITIKTSPTN